MIIPVQEETAEMVEVLVWEDEVVPTLRAGVVDGAVIGNLISQDTLLNN